MNYWKVQFPTTVSADMHTFAILRTIYVINKVSPMSQAQTAQMPLPLDSTRELRRRWPVSGVRACPLPFSDAGPLKPEYQEYIIRIFPTARYIFFQWFYHIAAFELLETTRRPRIIPLSSMPNTIVRDLFCLHEHLPLLAFVGELAIMLWDVRDGINSQSIAKRISLTSTLQVLGWHIFMRRT